MDQSTIRLIGSPEWARNHESLRVSIDNFRNFKAIITKDSQGIFTVNISYWFIYERRLSCCEDFS